MRYTKTVLVCLILSCLFFLKCKLNNNDYNNKSEKIYGQDGYPNGIYCAEIDYYYSDTGRSSTYTLEVEIEDNKLAVIHWPNGGWLDSSHFLPPDISSGKATFNSDNGVDYTVTIIDIDGDCDARSVKKNKNDLLQKVKKEDDVAR